MTTPELPPLPVVAYLYHDGESAETLSPLLHSIGLVAASDRRKEWRNETPLTTLAHAESARAPLVAEVDRLRARVAELEAAQAWRPIDTAPRDGTAVIIAAWSKHLERWNVCEAQWLIPSARRCILDASIHRNGATHWMPLPPPPQKEQGNG